MTHLLKMFDELKHYHNELFRWNEQDTFTLLDACDHMHQKWQVSEHELEGLRRVLASFETDLTKARFENKELRSQLVEARSQISGLATARKELERDRITLERQIDMVRDLLRDEVHSLPEYNRKKLQFLMDRPASTTTLPRNESYNAVSNEGIIDYDKTGDSTNTEIAAAADARGRKESNEASRPKRSRSATRVEPSAPFIDDMDTQAPRKRSKEEPPSQNPNQGAVVATATFTIPINGGEPRALTEIHRTPTLNRSFSEPHIMGLPQTPQLRPMKSVADLAVLSPATDPTHGRRHTFLQKTSFKAEYCDHCDRRFAFASAMWRCEICKLQCHSECREYALLPCIAHGTPAAKSQRGILADFVPREPPMIPNVIVHCVNEIERRGVTSVGLYRVPGSEAEVNELLERFLFGRGTPNLRLVLDINVIAGCIKKFLHQLREPLIPTTSWHEFVKSASMVDRIREALPLLHRAIVDLPQPNRDTLAFLVIHLQKVAYFANENKMPINNLATVFGPTIVGYSSTTIDMQQGINETHNQVAVMKLMLDLSPEYWGRFLASSECRPLIGSSSVACTDMLGRTSRTPGTSTFCESPKSMIKSRTPHRKFFNPPWK